MSSARKLKSNMLAEPVLVGRKRELEELKRYLELAAEGRGTTVFVSAEAGIGKTRLVHEFLYSARQEKDVMVLTGWCLSNAGIPYFPFIEAFTDYYSSLSDKNEREQVELNSWFTESPKNNLTGNLEYLSPQALKDQTFIAVAKAIHSIASKNLVILFIEDIHWADSASLALIHYIARAINNLARVLVLTTFRSEELTNDSEGYPHQLVETLSMMRREDLFSEIKLSGLSQAGVSRMAESMLGGTLQQGLAEKLAIKSEGNPLFVVESLRMLHEQENLIQKNNEWHLIVKKIEIPSKMKDIIIQRLACLNNVQRRIIDAASVIGDEFEVGLLSVVVDQDSLDVLETLNSIAQSTSIVCVDEDRFRFDHARSREIIYGAIAKPLRQGYHSRIAEKLESSKSAVLPFNSLAYHYEHSGNKEKALKYALAAGQD
jgi:predicted ATPase